MRVLHLSAGNLYGGVETFLVALARCRPCSRMEPVFGLCFEGRVADELRLEGAEVRQLGRVRLSRPWTVSRARRHLRDMLNGNGFDVAVCHSAWPLTVFGSTVIQAGVPLVYWAHSPPSNHWIDWPATRVAPDLVVANSRFTLAQHRSIYLRSRKTVLYCPVPANAVADRTTARQAVRRELDTHDEDVVIVCSSRLEPWKGHRLLLDALASLRDLDGWTAWIAGGAQRQSEQHYLTELTRTVSSTGLGGRVRFIGQRSDIPRVLAAADIHCQPNTGPEPFGIGFIEALHASVPVVTSSIGAAPEIVTPDCGLLVPPDIGALAAALRELIESREVRSRLAAGGPARAAALCGPEAAMAAIETELARAVARSEEHTSELQSPCKLVCRLLLE